MGAGIDEVVGWQASKVFPVGNGRGPAGGQRGAFTAGDLLDEEGLDDFGGVPALRSGGGEDVRCLGPHVGQPHPAQQRFHIGR